MSTSSIPLAAPAPSGLIDRQPALFATGPLEPASALGALFTADVSVPDSGSSARRERAWNEIAARRLGELTPALALLPARERRRAVTLAAWLDAIFATAREGDRTAKRLERLHRSAFVLARALAGERVECGFAQCFAAESARRAFGRSALDPLLGEAAAAISHPPSAPGVDWQARSRRIGGAIAAALLGQVPSDATVDAAEGLVRLLALATPPPGGAPRLTSAERSTRAAAVSSEAEAIHPLLLRGARAVGEVPLTFRRALAGFLTLGLQLLGVIEARPERCLDTPPRLGRLARAWTLFRLRRDKLV